MAGNTDRVQLKRNLWWHKWRFSKSDKIILKSKTMSNPSYDVIHYRSKFMEQVVDVLHYLWGDDHNSNISYFKWKYCENPYVDHPLGMVALYNGSVVGFRGYFPAKWQISPSEDEIIILCPGDTCVHPDHRRKGLSVIMGNAAIEQYAQEYKIFLNMTSTRISMPGYLRIGFLPIVDKAYITRCSMLGSTIYILTRNKKASMQEARIAFGEFDNILVENGPRPHEMADIVASQKPDGRKIALLQNRQFFLWRFNNKRNKYAFYYCRDDNKELTAYVVIGVSQNNRRGYILDCAETKEGSIENILKHIINKRHFDVMSIYNFNLNPTLLQTLQVLSFKTNSLMRMIESRFVGEVPLFVRPVKPNSIEEDWYIKGLDIRDVRNWSLKPICSDDA